MCAHIDLSWRSEPGSYMLLLRLDRPASIGVGRFGCVSFAPGRYVYTGSALGPGGVAARLGRHLRPEKPCHWHIDYLTAVLAVTGATVSYGSERLECAWSRALHALPGAAAPIRGFGSSDCRSGCAAHLWRLPDALRLTWIEEELTKCPIQAI